MPFLLKEFRSRDPIENQMYPSTTRGIWSKMLIKLKYFCCLYSCLGQFKFETTQLLQSLNSAYFSRNCYQDAPLK